MRGLHGERTSNLITRARTRSSLIRIMAILIQDSHSEARACVNINVIELFFEKGRLVLLFHPCVSAQCLTAMHDEDQVETKGEFQVHKNWSCRHNIIKVW